MNSSFDDGHCARDALHGKPRAATPVAAQQRSRSAVGLFCCSVVAAVIFPVLFIAGWATCSPIYSWKECVELFVALRDGAYALFSGRVFKRMVLHYPFPRRPDEKPRQR